MKLAPSRRLVEILSRSFFIFSLCLVALIYGVFAGQYKLFPFHELRDAKAAAVALVQVLEDTDDSEDSTQNGPLVRNHAGIDDGALILVSGRHGHLKSHNPDGGCLAWLMDRNGEIKHIWKYPPELWSDLKRTSTVPGASDIYPVGLHLLEDGGLIVSFQGRNTWPFAIGIARLDKDSNIIWQKECRAHHWLTVTSDQKIITPTLRILESPQRIGKTRGKIIGKDGKIFEDTITFMSLDGEILEEISMLDAMHDSGLIGLYQGATGEESPDVDSMDPLHLNAIQQVGEQVASTHDWLNPEDLLVSFRSINTIAILDRTTARVKWLATGTTLRQHSPIFKDSDSILVFDNLGGNKSLGGTRMAQLALSSRRAETIFPTQAHQSPSFGKVLSETAGHLQLNRGKDAVLMTISRQSRVLEIDLNDQTVAWEYIHPGRIQTAKYCYDVSFEMNQEKKK